MFNQKENIYKQDKRKGLLAMCSVQSSTCIGSNNLNLPIYLELHPNLHKKSENLI